MEDLIRIGIITGAHGIKGEVKVKPLTDFPDRFNDTKSVYCDYFNDFIKIMSAKEQKDYFIIKFDKIVDRNMAETIRGAYLSIDKKDVMELPEDSYYQYDLIGLKVYTVQKSYLGELTDIIESPANDVFVVKSDSGKELLIPALKKIVTKVSIADKVMVVDLPKGLGDEDEN